MFVIAFLVDPFSRKVSMYILRAVPANYPLWLRTKSTFWWNLVAVPADILKQKGGVDFFLEKIFSELATHSGTFSCVLVLSLEFIVGVVILHRGVDSKRLHWCNI